MLQGKFEAYKEILEYDMNTNEKLNLFEKSNGKPWLNDGINSIHQFTDQEGNNALHLACKHDKTEIFKYLGKICQINLKSLDRDFRQVIELGNKQGITGFLYTVKNMNHSLVNFLIEDGLCSIQSKTNEDQNVLHLAAINRDIRTICLILCIDCQQNGLVKQKDHKDRLPADYADKNGEILLNSKEFKEGNLSSLAPSIVCEANALIPPSPMRLPKIEKFRASIKSPSQLLGLDRNPEMRSALLVKNNFK